MDDEMIMIAADNDVGAGVDVSLFYFDFVLLLKNIHRNVWVKSFLWQQQPPNQPNTNH